MTSRRRDSTLVQRFLKVNLNMKPIIPPQCIGIMGGGQLARMLAISAKQMGYQIAILEPDINCPAKLFANHHIIGKYDDEAALDKLAKLCAVITTEFENVPANSMQYLAEKTLVFPKHTAIEKTQNRVIEKNFFNSIGVKTTQYCSIAQKESIGQIKEMNDAIFPAILKTNTLGYDGKGQITVNNKIELIDAFKQLNQVPSILEKKVALKQEVSIMVARNSNGEIACYPVVENIHINGILDTTIAPADITEDLRDKIKEAAENIIRNLEYVGILGIEFFITENNEILANEMAPRPHNSGHYTIDACMVSQFEQQVRAICNLKLGDTNLMTRAIMLNLLGDIWPQKSNQQHPAWDKILGAYDNVKLHLYDKMEARKARKMGHLTVLGYDILKLKKQIQEIKQLLKET